MSINSSLALSNSESSKKPIMPSLISSNWWVAARLVHVTTPFLSRLLRKSPFCISRPFWSDDFIFFSFFPLILCSSFSPCLSGPEQRLDVIVADRVVNASSEHIEWRKCSTCNEYGLNVDLYSDLCLLYRQPLRQPLCSGPLSVYKLLFINRILYFARLLSHDVLSLGDCNTKQLASDAYIMVIVIESFGKECDWMIRDCYSILLLVITIANMRARHPSRIIRLSRWYVEYIRDIYRQYTFISCSVRQSHVSGDRTFFKVFIIR